MHLLVLSAFRQDTVLLPWNSKLGLNAHFGAQCFPTTEAVVRAQRMWDEVSMHLLVLSAFRPTISSAQDNWTLMFQCTFWCSVLSDLTDTTPVPHHPKWFQCTFWCSVLSDVTIRRMTEILGQQFQCTFWCSVLSDPQSVPRKTTGLLCFNAPFGAQCFPT